MTQKEKFQKTLIALKECLALNEARTPAPIKSTPEFLSFIRKEKYLRKAIIKCIDAANKKCVKKTGKTRGRSADFELATAIDPTEETIKTKHVSDEEVELKLNIVHQDKSVVEKTLKEFVKCVGADKKISGAKLESFEAADEDSTGTAKVSISLVVPFEK